MNTTSTELPDSPEQYKALVESVTDYAIFMVDPRGIVKTWNLGAQRIMGYSRAEILGKHYSCFFTPEDVRAGLPANALAQAQRSGRHVSEGFRVRKNGERFRARAVLIALLDSRGLLLGFGKVAQDLTERWRLEQELREKNAELERALRTTFSPEPASRASKSW